MDISVVIPVYGCKAALPELYRRLTESLSQITDKYEIILVDDNCPQNSGRDRKSFCQKDEKAKGFHLSRNFGQIRAITAGLDKSKGDWIVVMDCDLQDKSRRWWSFIKRHRKAMMLCFEERKVDTA